MADPVPQNGVISAADVLSKLAPIFLGSGTTTGSETSTSSPDGIANLQNIITEAMGNVNDPAQVQAIISNIMTQAAQTFAPVLAQQNSSGLYNSSTLSMLSAMASGQATAQSAQAVLNFKTSQEQIAAQAAGQLANATKTTTQTKATGPVVDPVSSLLTIGGGVLATKGINALAASAPVQAAKTAVSNFFNPAAPLSDAANTVDASHVASEIGFQNSSTPILDSAVTAGDSTGAAAAGALDDTTAGAISAASVDLGADTAAAVGSDIGSSAATDLAGGIGENVGESVATDAGASVGSDIATSAVSDTATSAAADSGGGIIDSLGSSWIICTELVRQGRMNKRYYIVGSKEFANYWEYGKRGYYLWAIPAVRHLRSHPTSKWSYVLERIFNWRIEEIAASKNYHGAQHSFKGAMARYLLWGACAFLAITVCPFLKKPDWLSLYNEEKA